MVHLSGRSSWSRDLLFLRIERDAGLIDELSSTKFARNIRDQALTKL
jgi:hypothetical protein